MAENEITVADRTGYLVNDLNRCRQAITYRGGTVSAKEGFMDIPDSIANIPLSSSIGTVTDDTLDSIKLIPSNSVPACYIKSIGGMTYKCENLMPFPYIASDIYNSNISLGVGDSYNFGSETLTVNADRSITISRAALETLTYPVSLSVTVPSADYYLTVFKISSEGDDNISISSNVGNIPYGESVFIPASTGITEIVLSASPEPYSCTLKIILSKYPYFEGLKDTKTTAVKVHGANLIPFPYYSKSNTSNGITATVNDDGSITFNGTATDKVVFILSTNIPLSPNESYILSADNFVEGLICSAAVKYDANLPSLYTNITANTPANVMHKGYKVSDLRIMIPSGTVCNNLVFKPMINIGTTALPYAPYHEPITYEIPESLQGTGKGVEGAADTVDFENDKKITRVGEADLSDLIWAIAPYGFYSYGLKTKFIGNLILSADYTTDTWSNVYSEKTDRCISGNGSAIIISDSRYTDETSFKASLVGKKILYALAEPTEESIDTSIFNNIPTVEPGGYLEFVTDNGFAPNSSVGFQTIP